MVTLFIEITRQQVASGPGRESEWTVRMHEIPFRERAEAERYAGSTYPDKMWFIQGGI